MPNKKALRQIEDNTILYFGWPRKWQRRSHCTELVASNHLNSAQTKAKSLAKKISKPIGVAESNSQRWQPQSDELCFWGRLSNEGRLLHYVCCYIKMLVYIYVSYFSNLILSRINFDIRMIMTLERFFRPLFGSAWLLHFGKVDEINIRLYSRATWKLQAHSLPAYQ